MEPARRSGPGSRAVACSGGSVRSSVSCTNCVWPLARLNGDRRWRSCLAHSPDDPASHDEHATQQQRSSGANDTARKLRRQSWLNAHRLPRARATGGPRAAQTGEAEPAPADRPSALRRRRHGPQRRAPRARTRHRAGLPRGSRQAAVPIAGRRRQRDPRRGGPRPGRARVRLARGRTAVPPTAGTRRAVARRRRGFSDPRWGRLPAGRRNLPWLGGQRFWASPAPWRLAKR